MKNECNIVKDLLPLYAEKMVSGDTAAFVEEHLKGCAACREAFEQTKEPQPAPQTDAAAPLQTLRRKLKAMRVQTVALTALFVTALLVSAAAVLGAPVYIPYSADLVTVEPYGDTGVLLSFSEEVTRFDYTLHNDPEESGVRVCDIEAWTTLWDKWSKKGSGRVSAVVTSAEGPMRLFYVSNDASENVCLAEYDPDAETRLRLDGETRGVMTLPRLTLGYYLILACGALGVGCVAWLITRKKANVRVWVERLGLYPAAYIVSHCVVSGVNWATYSISRDFAFILFLSILLYGGLLLLHNVILLKIEIKKQMTEGNTLGCAVPARGEVKKRLR